MMGKTEAVKNYPGGIGPVQRVKVNTRYFVIQEIATLFQRVLNANASDRFGIILAFL